MNKETTKDAKNTVEEVKTIKKGIAEKVIRENPKSVYEKLQNARAEIVQQKITKGGKNKHKDYTYYELPDFLTKATIAFNNNRLTPVFNPYTEYAELIIYDWDSDKEIKFRTDTADATVLNSKTGNRVNLEIQDLGSTHTYLKRYLYINAIELAEPDSIDPDAGNPQYQPQEPKRRKKPDSAATPLYEKATEEQVEIAEKVFTKEIIERMLTAYKVKTIQDMPKNELHKALTIQLRKIENDKKEKETEKEADSRETVSKPEKEEPAAEKKHVPRLDDII